MKKIVSLILLMSLVLSCFSFATELPRTQAEADKIGFKVIHVDVTNAGVATTRDVPVPFKENVEMRNQTSTYAQIATAAAIAQLFSSKFGGPAAPYMNCAIGVAAAMKASNTQNVYQIVRYYWQPSNSQPGLPYYIKQVLYNYSDVARTKFINTNTRYYYSNVTY